MKNTTMTYDEFIDSKKLAVQVKDSITDVQLKFIEYQANVPTLFDVLAS